MNGNTCVPIAIGVFGSSRSGHHIVVPQDDPEESTSMFTILPENPTTFTSHIQSFIHNWHAWMEYMEVDAYNCTNRLHCCSITKLDQLKPISQFSSRGTRMHHASTDAKRFSACL
ncbi:hypothetical protein ACJX0J_014070, partial [Zea mays]